MSSNPLARPPAYHVLLKQTAVDMAGELYEELMKDNDWWALWRASHPGASRRGLEAIFIRQTWPGLVPQAKATLTGLLAQPISQVLKDQIYEALILNHSLPRGGKAVGGVPQ